MADQAPEAHELRDLAKAVLYEHSMWALAHHQLTAPGGSLGIPEKNAWLETFLVHSRNLIAFYRSLPKQDDLLATHFAPEWEPGASGDLTWLIDYLPAINKSLMHLTIARVREPKPRHPITTIHGHLQAVGASFAQSLPNDRRAWFNLAPRLDQVRPVVWTDGATSTVLDSPDD